MAQGPSLQGQIVINTRSVDQAIASVRKLQTNVEKAFGLGGKAASDFSRTLENQSKTYTRVANSAKKHENIIAKAANQVANYEAAVRKSNATDQKKEQLIKRATASLKGFETAVRAGATGGQKLENVTTELNVSLGQLRRDLASTAKAERDKAKAAKELEQAQVRNEKAMSTANIQYQKAEAAIRASSMSEADKLVKLRQLDEAHKKLNATLSNTGNSVRTVSAAQNRYKEAINQVNIATRKSRMSDAISETNAYAKEMRNLSTSVVVALGPLSGVASRLTALTTLFNRNAASIAAVLSSLTGLSVLFAQSAAYAQEAEKQMFRVNAQLDILADNAQVTGEEINYMAHEIAAGTLLAARDVRDATGALIEFGGVGRSQFQDVVKVAQGMSVVFGGNLQGNIRKLGRAIDEPVEGLQRLERYGIILDESIKDQIETLSAQGRRMEATNLLLKETASLQKAAEGEAKGLAGAYDTVAGNLDKLYENLFVTSGAAETLTDSVMEVADAIAAFTASDQAAAMGEAFKGIARFAGTAFTAIVNNIDLVAGGLAFIAGSVIPKALIAFITLSVKGIMSAANTAKTAAASLTAYSAATGKATTATKIFNTTLKANPIIAVASGLATLVASVWSYNEALDAVKASGATIHETAINQIEAEIIANQDLTKTQANRFREEKSALEENLKASISGYEKQTAQLDRLKEAAREAFDWGWIGGGVDENLLNSIEGLEILLKRDLSPAQRAVVEDLYRSAVAADELGDRYDDVIKKLEQLKKTVRETQGEQESTPVNQQLNNQLETIDELSKSYLKQRHTIADLNKELENVNEISDLIRKNIANNAYGSEQAEKASQALRTLGQLQQSLNREIRDATYTDNFRSLSEAMDEAVRKAGLLRASIGKTDEEKAILELSYDMKSLAEETERVVEVLGSAELARLTDMLPGVDASSGIKEITAAYVEFIKAQRQAQMQAELEAEATDTVKEFYDDRKSSMQSLVAEYGNLQRAAIMASESDVPNMDIAQWYSEQKNKIADQAADLASSPFSGTVEEIQKDFEARQETLSELYSKESDQYKQHLATMKKEADKQKVFAEFANGAEAAADIVGQSMQLMETANRENSSAYKAMAIMQATIASSLAIAKVWADNPNPAYAIPMTALVAANLGAQIASIKSQSYATGGYVTGPGTSTSDSIPANLSNGEFVMRADAVRQIGLRNLEMMNAGNMPQFNTGGMIGVRPMAVSGSGYGGDVNVTIVDQSTGAKEYSQEETIDASGQRNLKIMIRDTVKDSINKGELDREMGTRYGVRNKGRLV